MSATSMSEDIEFETDLRCAGCGLAYSDPGWCDVVIPTHVWVQISPRGDEGGVLCLTCIARALTDKGIDRVPMIVTSGPWLYASDHSIISPRATRPPRPVIEK